MLEPISRGAPLHQAPDNRGDAYRPLTSVATLALVAVTAVLLSYLVHSGAEKFEELQVPQALELLADLSRTCKFLGCRRPSCSSLEYTSRNENLFVSSDLTTFKTSSVQPLASCRTFSSGRSRAYRSRTSAGSAGTLLTPSQFSRRGEWWRAGCCSRPSRPVAPLATMAYAFQARKRKGEARNQN